MAQDLCLTAIELKPTRNRFKQAMRLTTGQSIQIKKDQYINNAHRALKSHETLTFLDKLVITSLVKFIPLQV